MRYDNLPIYKSALDLCVYVETMVKIFDKYHKYTIGEDLRSFSKDLLFLIHRANISQNKKEFLEDLRNKCEDLKIKHYLRYVDDFVLFHKDKNQLIEAKRKIEKYLKDDLDLYLRDDFKLKQNSQGLDFLGYIIRPNYLLVRNRVVNNFKYKKAKYLKRYEALKGNMSLEEIKQFLCVQASYKGHCSHANSYNLIQKTGGFDEEKYIELNVAN